MEAVLGVDVWQTGHRSDGLDDRAEVVAESLVKIPTILRVELLPSHSEGGPRNNEASCQRSTNRNQGYPNSGHTRDTTPVEPDDAAAASDPTELSKLVDELAAAVVQRVKTSKLDGMAEGAETLATDQIDADLVLEKTREALQWVVGTIFGDVSEAFANQTDMLSNASLQPKPRAFWIGPYRPTQKAIQQTYEVEDDMEMLSFEGMASIGSTDGSYPPGVDAIPDPTLRKTFFDALIDLHRLVEEYRFHVAFAHLLMFDVSERVQDGTALKIESDPIFDQLGIPDEARALLLPFWRRPSSVTEFFSNPHEVITGHRRRSSWLAGQLLDSALVRGVAACDRVATLLWARAGVPIAQRYGERYLPSFLPRQLARLDSFYADRPEWPELKKLAEHGIYTSARSIRNGFTHSRRIPSELHGEKVVATANGEPVQGLGVGLHLAFGLDLYKLVLEPVVEYTRRLLTETVDQ
ncbi:MAG: hypothetical protein JWM06_142 [Actinomycetia bacterium]|nr:hypothetical protein [Actinomycetes bacterium]